MGEALASDSEGSDFDVNLNDSDYESFGLQIRTFVGSRKLIVKEIP